PGAEQEGAPGRAGRDTVTLHGESSMSKPGTPEERARSLVGAGCKVPGGPWFVELKELLHPPLFLGPYRNPSGAREDADRIRQFLAAALREAGQAAQAGG